MRRGNSYNRCNDNRPGMSLMLTYVWYAYAKKNFRQDVFVIPEGAPGALAELERRKFTAEEGVSVHYVGKTAI